MKYFTPERYLGLGNLSNEPAFLASQQAWEAAIADYQRHLATIKRSLPRDVRKLLASVYMHDAAVVNMWQQDDSEFEISLQTESDPGRLVVLHYALVEPAQIDRAALPDESRSDPVEWLYDEWDVKPAKYNGTSSGKILTHDILLSNGWELSLRARRVTIRRPVGLVLAHLIG